MLAFLYSNFNSFCSVNKSITYYHKVDLFTNHISKKYGLDNITAIVLTEYISGTSCKYLQYLEDKLEGKFDVITPQRYPVTQHPKALLTIICVNRTMKYTVADQFSPLRNRLNCVLLWPEGKDHPIKLLAAYMVQTSVFFPSATQKYRNERMQFHDQMWSSIFASVDEEEDVAVIGDLQEQSSDENIAFLRDQFGFYEKVGLNETVTNADLDHVLLSSKEYKIYFNEIDTSLVGQVSDHALSCTIVM